MKKRAALVGWALLLLAGLVVLELTRRAGATAVCYVELRYARELIAMPREEKWEECARRHLLFPFYF